jgi:hypothetical protein
LGALCHARGREKEKNRERDMARIGIENISVFGLPPVEFVNLAGDLGCQHISTGLSGYTFGVHAHRQSPRADATDPRLHPPTARA